MQPSSFSRPNVSVQPTSNLLGSQTATLTRQRKNITPRDEVSVQIDDTIYEMPEQPDLELGDGLIDRLGVEANGLLDSNFVTPQEENDVLEHFKEDYNFDEIKKFLDQGIVHESVEFFYGADNDSFVQNVEFLNPNSDSREFVVFLLSDLGRNVMTSNRLSIHFANNIIVDNIILF